MHKQPEPQDTPRETDEPQPTPQELLAEQDESDPDVGVDGTGVGELP